jgi:phenylpropionate dioxygenase-like ring-hydroxylating dioxygenase large terminal subunit
MFLRNTWYMAAWASELKDRPVGRTFLNEPVVLFRGANGTVGALENRCCHRAMPLALGELAGDNLRCIYHGLEFDTEGTCVHIPGQDSIPRQARVKSYPIVEQDQIIWIWMGDLERADASKIIAYPWHQDPKWAWASAGYRLGCSYLLLQDNLLDLTHLAYVHRHTIGGSPNAHFEAKTDVERDGDCIKLRRWIPNSEPPATYVKAVGFKGKVDRWQETQAWLGVMHIYTGATDAGTGAYEGKRDGGFGLRLFEGLTPETETSTNYFWSAAHNYKVDQPDATAQLYREIKATVDEDVVVLEEQQKMLDADPDRGFVGIKFDAGPNRARVMIDTLIEAERVSARGTLTVEEFR